MTSKIPLLDSETMSRPMNIALLYASTTGNTKFVGKQIKKHIEETSDITVTLYDLNKLFKNHKTGGQEVSFPEADGYILGSLTIAYRPQFSAIEYLDAFPESLIRSKPIAVYAVCAGQAIGVCNFLARPLINKGAILVESLNVMGINNGLMGATDYPKTPGMAPTWPRVWLDKVYTWAVSLPPRFQDPLQHQTSASLLRGLTPKFSKSLVRKIIGEITIDDDRCTRCLACVRSCPHSSLVLHEGRVVYSPEDCEGCCTCFHACRFNAIGGKGGKYMDFPKYRFEEWMVVDDTRRKDTKESLVAAYNEHGRAIPQPHAMNLTAVRRRKAVISWAVVAGVVAGVASVVWMIVK